MAFDPITAVSNALAQAGAALQPVIDQHYQELYEEQHADRMAEFQEIVAGTADPRRIGDFVVRLLTRAGTPPGLVSDRSIEVPLDDFVRLVAKCSEDIRDKGLLSRMEFKTAK